MFACLVGTRSSSSRCLSTKACRFPLGFASLFGARRMPTRVCLSGRHSQQQLLADNGYRLVVCLPCTVLRCEADANCVSIWPALTTAAACQQWLPPCLFALHCSSVRGGCKMSACQQRLPPCLFALHCCSVRGGCKLCACLAGTRSSSSRLLLADKGGHHPLCLALLLGARQTQNVCLSGRQSQQEQLAAAAACRQRLLPSSWLSTGVVRDLLRPIEQ